MKQGTTDIASNLKRLRKERGDLSQKKLAAISGVSFRTIQNVESEISDSGAFSLVSLADALGCTVDELVRKNLTTKASPTVESLSKIISDQEKRLQEFEIKTRVLSRISPDLINRLSSADEDQLRRIARLFEIDEEAQREADAEALAERNSQKRKKI